MNTVGSIQEDAKSRMQKSLAALKQELAKLRTGRAHTSLLDHIHVSYYGTEMPLNQVASISIADPRTLSVTPWEKRMVPEVEKAIMNSELGLNPVTAGEVIRVPLPPLTEERRRDMIKVVRHEGENTRIAIRNIRRDANAHLKKLIKDESLPRDTEHRAEAEIQKTTDRRIAAVDEVLKAKESELMEF
jgi:ribosome recycling factor